MAEQVLLDAGNTGGRVIQSLLPLIGVVLGAIGVTILVRAAGEHRNRLGSDHDRGRHAHRAAAAARDGWDVSYKGHRIRFENDACSANVS